MGGSLLIGVDVGTTAVKAALFDAGGETRRRFSSAYATTRPAPGFVEQDPSDWMSRVLAGIGELVAGLPQGAVAGIGLCSQVNTHVFVDESGRALLPAIIWQDGRCAEDARQLDRLVASEDRLKWWGAPLPIDASHVLSRMAWVRRTHPEDLAQDPLGHGAQGLLPSSSDRRGGRRPDDGVRRRRSDARLHP